MAKEKMKRIVIMVAVLFLGSFPALCAFAFENGDWQFWNTYGADAKLGEKVTLKGENELRFGDGMGELYYDHIDTGIYYKATDWLDLGINYRHIWEKKARYKWAEEYRPHFNGVFKWQWWDLEFKDRNRVELRIRDGKEDKWRYRNKLTMSYPVEIKDIEVAPYVADEIFVDFHGTRLNRNRLYGGVQIKLYKHIKADIFYLWQTSKDKPGKWTGYNVLGAKLKAVF